MVARNIKGILVLSLILVFGGCAGSSKYMSNAPPLEFDPIEGKAIVYFLRPSSLGFAINFQIWDRDRFLGLSQAKSYFSYVCDPGKHLFIGIAENKVAVEADLAPGKSYYIVTEPRMGGWRARLAMVPVTKGSEYWDKIQGWKGELIHIAPVESEIRTWGAEKKAEALTLIDFFENDPKKGNYIARLTPEDGI